MYNTDKMVNTHIKFLNLDDAPQELIDDISGWDNSVPLNIYLGIKGWNLDRRMFDVDNSLIVKITGPVYYHPFKTIRTSRRKRISGNNIQSFKTPE